MNSFRVLLGVGKANTHEVHTERSEALKRYLTRSAERQLMNSLLVRQMRFNTDLIKARKLREDLPVLKIENEDGKYVLD